MNEAPSASSLNILLEDLQKPPGPWSPRAASRPWIKKCSRALISPPAIKRKYRVAKEGEFSLGWPQLLQGSEFQTQRQLLDSMIPPGDSARSCTGQVDAAVVGEMKEAVKKISAASYQEILKKAPASQYIAAKRFLDRLDDGLKVFGNQPRRRYYFSGKVFRRRARQLRNWSRT